MTFNKAAEAGAAQVTKFNIVSNKGLEVDISSGIAELYIYESVLDVTVRVSAQIVDAGFRKNKSSAAATEQDDLNLTAGEKSLLHVVDGSGNFLYFDDDYHLRVHQLRNVNEHTGSTTFTLDFYSKECIDNEIADNRVTKRYNGLISDSVKSILTNTLKTKKNVHVDKTITSFNFIGGIEKPFYKIPWLATKSIPDMPDSVGKYAGYFFYETANDGKGSGGYNFKSIDKFFTKSPKKKLIFTNTPYTPVGYDIKILTYAFSNYVNLDHSLKSGALTKPLLKTFNQNNNEYKEDNFFSDSERMSETNMGGRALPEIASDLELKDKTTKILFEWVPAGILPSGSNVEQQLNNLNTPDYNKEQITRQAKARYNNLFNNRLNITIPGDFSIHAGDVLSCDFPEISSKATKIISNKKSGNYLVIDVGHRINKTGCFTSLNLVRESIYKV
jgi:hypothetical protein